MSHSAAMPSQLTLRQRRGSSLRQVPRPHPAEVGASRFRQVTLMNTLLPFQPDAMTPAQLAAVSYLARYSGHTHTLYSSQLRRWFACCETNALDPRVGIQRSHIELYIRHLGQAGLMASSVVTTMHAVRGYFRYAHIDGLL